MNKVILSGNLCQNVELKKTTNGKEVVTNCIAVRRDYKNSNGEYESDFINIVLWGTQAVYLSKYGHKGDRVELVGRWTIRKYEDNNGTTKVVNECVVESITVFGKAQKEEKAEPNYEELPEGDDLPF